MACKDDVGGWLSKSYPGQVDHHHMVFTKWLSYPYSEWFSPNVQHLLTLRFPGISDKSDLFPQGSLTPPGFKSSKTCSVRSSWQRAWPCGWLHGSEWTQQHRRLRREKSFRTYLFQGSLYIPSGSKYLGVQVASEKVLGSVTNR